MKMSSFLHAQDGNTSRSAAAPSTATPTTNTITTTTTLAGGSLCANQCSRRLSSVLTERRQLQKNLSSWTPLRLQLTGTPAVWDKAFASNFCWKGAALHAPLLW